MKSGAPGIEGVEVSLKAMNKNKKRRLFNVVIKHLEELYYIWEEANTIGWVVQLFKKYWRGDLNNYRGECLLPLINLLCSRILATGFHFQVKVGT